MARRLIGFPGRQWNALSGPFVLVPSPHLAKAHIDASSGSGGTYRGSAEYLHSHHHSRAPSPPGAAARRANRSGLLRDACLPASFCEGSQIGVGLGRVPTFPTQQLSPSPVTFPSRSGRAPRRSRRALAGGQRCAHGSQSRPATDAVAEWEPGAMSRPLDRGRSREWGSVVTCHRPAGHRGRREDCSEDAREKRITLLHMMMPQEQ